MTKALLLAITQGLKVRAACETVVGVPIVASTARAGFDFTSKWARMRLDALDALDASLHFTLGSQ